MQSRIHVVRSDRRISNTLLGLTCFFNTLNRFQNLLLHRGMLMFSLLAKTENMMKTNTQNLAWARVLGYPRAKIVRAID